MAAEAVHVLHVVRTLGKAGGLERNLYRVVRALAARGLRHSIALLSDFQDIIDFGSLAEVHRVPTRPNDPWLVAKLRALIARLGPTVIHARNFGSWPDVAAARLLFARRPPLIFSYHGMESDPDQVPAKQRLAFLALAPITTRIFAVSSAAKHVLTSTFGLAPRRVEVIHNGVDTERFRPGPPRPQGTRLRIGSTGRLHTVKNFGLLIAAAAQARRQGLDVEVAIAGEGHEREHLEVLAKAEQVPTQLLGYTEDIPAFLQGLDLFVLSSHNEANPNVLLEAMATGLPAVATAVGGVPEVTGGGQAARLIPAGDASALTQALLELGADPAARARLGQVARAHVLQHHSQAQMFDAYERLYRAPRERP